MNPLQKMQMASGTFTKTDQKIYQFIKENPAETVHLNIQDIASKINVSKSAILRFTKGSAMMASPSLNLTLIVSFTAVRIMSAIRSTHQN